ncbi:hypothetical protein V6N11_049567 [Hibiscus sabdariffa]|uniref:Uncharacterized protein n=1 Tax=Hibiscus sabdariffa TaxID=183260 RepID=A0ABR2NMS9_9ROSI
MEKEKRKRKDYLEYLDEQAPFVQMNSRCQKNNFEGNHDAELAEQQSSPWAEEFDHAKVWIYVYKLEALGQIRAVKYGPLMRETQSLCLANWTQKQTDQTQVQQPLELRAELKLNIYWCNETRLTKLKLNTYRNRGNGLKMNNN